MSTLSVDVCRVGSVIKHPNADRLDIVTVKGWQCITPRNSYGVNDLVIYVPIDAVFPQTLSDKINITKYLHSQRVKTAKLRGVISQGVIMSVDEVPGCTEGQDVSEVLGITKWEPPLPGACTSGTPRPQHPDFLRYTDIENLKNYPDVLQIGEEVVLTEKIHGTNFRAANIINEKDGEVGHAGIHAGSHRMDFVDTPENLYWKAAHMYKLDEILPPGYQIFGEIYGRGVQKLTYDLQGIDVRFFDLMVNLKYVNYDEFKAFCDKHNLPTVPELYRGPYDKDCARLADGQSTIAGHIREGWVGRPILERWDHKVGRGILKAVSEQYLLSKDSDEVVAH